MDCCLPDLSVFMVFPENSVVIACTPIGKHHRRVDVSLSYIGWTIKFILLGGNTSASYVIIVSAMSCGFLSCRATSSSTSHQNL